MSPRVGGDGQQPISTVRIQCRLPGGRSVLARAVRELERRVWQIATRRGIRPTALMRQYIEAGVAADADGTDVVALLSHAQADIARAQQLASEHPGREAA